ncbi:MAG: hypothetical protein PHX21_09370 [bacterium]|nr:hypothetical protein [bacterium]
MSQEEKDIFVMSLIGLILASIPTVLYIVDCIGEETFHIFNHIGNLIFMMGLAINIRTLVNSNWLQNNLKLKIILTLLYSNVLLVLWYVTYYLSFTQYEHTTKYPTNPSMKSSFIMDLSLSIFGSAVIIISILKKHKKLKNPLKK